MAKTNIDIKSWIVALYKMGTFCEFISKRYIYFHVYKMYGTHPIFLCFITHYYDIACFIVY